MLITSSNICQYLIARGLISSESVVDGDFAVTDVSGRNRNFKILRGRNPGYFLKQIQNWDPQTIAMLQCEAACYWLALNDTKFAPLASLMPEFCWFDSERHILITRLIPHGENLYQYFRRLSQFPSDVAGKLGTVVGTYHRETEDGLKDNPHANLFPKQIPWILSEDRRNSHPFRELTRATQELFEEVEKTSHLRQALQELRNDWHADTLVHGDMRLENCILFRNAKSGELSLKVVDWELADIGDPCWDVGSIIQAFLSTSLVSSTGAFTSYSLNETQAAIQSLWHNYVKARGLETAKSMDLLERSIRYGAARMVQSAYEQMQFSNRISQRASYLVQVSSDILKDPANAIRELLKMDSVIYERRVD